MAKVLELLDKGVKTPEVSPTLQYWPESVRNNPRREMDLPRLIVPMFGPVSSAYAHDEDDAWGMAD
jgi:hypothetical protein